MSTLQGRSLAETYKDLLQVSNSNIGVDGTIRYVEDGEGTSSALSISTSKVGVGINDWTTNEVFNVQGDSLITGNLNVTGSILSNGGTVITTNNELAALGNVSLAQPTDGQILKYSGTTSQWTPSDDIATSYWSPAGTNDIYRFTGNVGIGTTNPLKPLHIAGPGHHIVIEDSNSSQETKYRGIYNNNQDLYMGRYDNTLSTFTSDMVIDKSGKVGIGTTSPAEELHILAPAQPYLKIEASDASESGVLLARQSMNTWRIINRPDQSDSLAIQGNGATIDQFVTITQTGRVGIGNTDPAANLHIGDLTSDSQWIRLGTQYGEFSIGNGSHNTPPVKYFSIYDGDVDQHRFFLLDSGDIGIGTTSPENRLHIVGTGHSKVLIDGGDSNAVGVQIKQNFTTPQIWQFQTQAGTRNLQIRNATLNTVPTHIDGTTGNVGIGTTSPASTFTIASNSNTGSTLSNDPPFIAIENTRSDYTDDFVFGGLAFTKSGATYNQNGNFSSGIRAGLVVRYDGASVSNTGSSNVGLKMDFHTAADGAGDGDVRMRIASNGNVSIGTTTPPNVKFSVVGSLQAIYGYRTTTSPDHDLMTLHSDVGGTTATKFKVEADGDVWSSSSTYSSDVRLKTQIDELKHGVDTLNQLQPKQYKMIGSESKGFKYGFVAQEIETVLPDLIRDVQVNNDEDGVYKALDYNSIIAVLTKAVQEQQTMIDELKSQNQSLINRIETLENK